MSAAKYFPPTIVQLRIGQIGSVDSKVASDTSAQGKDADVVARILRLSINRERRKR